MHDATALPEAVRGCWYRVPPSFDAEQGLSRERQVMAFGLDGSFALYDVNETRQRTKTGDYTFDGDFLIVRSRRTRTYRVQRPVFWRWELEGKKQQFHLYRGFVPGDRRRELSEEVLRDLRLLPLRARVEADFDGNDAIHRIVYPGEQHQRLLASFSVKQHDDHPLWIGVAPLVRGVDAKVWERIVSESYLDGHFPEQKQASNGVVLQLFDTGEQRRLQEG